MPSSSSFDSLPPTSFVSCVLCVIAITIQNKYLNHFIEILRLTTFGNFRMLEKYIRIDLNKSVQ